MGYPSCILLTQYLSRVSLPHQIPQGSPDFNVQILSQASIPLALLKNKTWKCQALVTCIMVHKHTS